MNNHPIRKSFLILLAGFVALFLFRFLYGYITHPASGNEIEQVAGGYQGSFQYAGKNYATKSAKFEKVGGGGGTRAPLSVDQKYEKIGTVSTKSKDYDADEKKIRETIVDLGGLIQFEQSSGLEGQRTLHLAVGVVPDKFDEAIARLKGIGTLTSIRIDKVDKTNEYKMLQAKRTSLEATKSSLQSLKEPGAGSIEELIELEAKISETETQIQDLGVNLGDYDAENEFCTVKCSLLEIVTRSTSGIGVAQRVKVALEWTAAIYLKLVIIGSLGTFAVWAAILAFFQIRRLMPKISKAIAASGEQ